jgi:hypothetical protein
MIRQKFSKGPKFIRKNLIRPLCEVAFITLFKENQNRVRQYSYNRLKANIIREEYVPWTSKFTFSSTNSDFKLYTKFPSVQGHKEGLNKKLETK